MATVMATYEEEIKYLKAKNNELVQKVQFWKMTAAQRENEKLKLMKEINELRLKLGMYRNNSNVQACNLEAALQSASEKALANLVRASGDIARIMELTKSYMTDRQELDMAPRWSSLSDTPCKDNKKEKVHRVTPMVGGKTIQPVVSLNRTILNTSHPGLSSARSPNHNRSVTTRAVPMHMLQDVYIPLTRIDAVQLNNMDLETEGNGDTSTEDLGLDDGVGQADQSERISDDDDFEAPRGLDAVLEDLDDEQETPPRSRADPLEGPSWLLDLPSGSRHNNTLEPDSTTELIDNHRTPTSIIRTNDEKLGMSVRVSCAFSPTLRRRKRSASPPASPLPGYSRSSISRRNSASGRVLKVLVAKMRLDGDETGSPPKRGARSPSASPSPSPSPQYVVFDAPSPNGATVPGVIVSHTNEDSMDVSGGGDAVSRRNSRESHESHSILRQDSHIRHASRANSPDLQLNIQDRDSRDQSPFKRQNSPVKRQKRREKRQMSDDSSDSRFDARDSRLGSHDSRDSDSGSGTELTSEGRSRRRRKPVTYKEKPLNRKLRR